MSAKPETNSRRSPRFNAALEVRFSINGGPEEVSNTLNFTTRSLAIRSECDVAKGDSVAVRLGGLPVLSGQVVRVFPEGFAATLDDASLKLMAGGQKEVSLAPFGEIDIRDKSKNKSSPFINAESAVPTRIQITTSLAHEIDAHRHLITLVTADPAAVSGINTIWLSASETRWTAQALRFHSRGNRGIVVMNLNDWQLHMAAAYGLTISMIKDNLDEQLIEIDAQPIAEHLAQVMPEKKASNG
ncbi:hypothetical protein ABFZ85_02380 [Hyphococcus formosus]|uniref:hypothetical protein n=1 Tax=Hyphococcus formosus TaxID=3143534 RepID=UPI00398AAD0B